MHTHSSTAQRQQNARTGRPDFGALTDAELVERSAGDPAAFGEIVRRHQTVVFGAAFRIVQNTTAAEDVAQEAFLRAYRSLSDYRADGDLRAWLYRIARNLALNVVTRSRETPTDDPPIRFEAKTPETEMLRAAEIEAVRAALLTLPELLRRPLVMKEYQGMPYEQIADEIGIPLNTVRTRIHRAKRALHAAMEDTR